MTEGVSREGETPTYIIHELGETTRVILALREHGRVIADFRGLDEPTALRVSDTLNGAAIAIGYSPFFLHDRVYLLTTEMPNPPTVPVNPPPGA